MYGMGMGRLGLPNRLANAVAAYNPATQFGGGGLGLWYDPSDYATLSQDSAGATPVTAAGQTVGRMLDKSGRGNTYSQATAAARALTATAGAILSHAYDGVDDSGATGAATFSADQDCFIAVRRSSSARAVLANLDAGSYFGLIDPAAGNVGQNVGAAYSVFVNGVNIGGVLAATLNTALTVGNWHVLEIRNLDLSTWTSFKFSSYSTYFYNGDFGGIILPPAGDATTRTNNRKSLGAKVGLSL